MKLKDDVQGIYGSKYHILTEPRKNGSYDTRVILLGGQKDYEIFSITNKTPERAEKLHENLVKNYGHRTSIEKA
jgi:hypothetical protein